jgi:putative oxidoreductase
MTTPNALLRFPPLGLYDRVNGFVETTPWIKALSLLAIRLYLASFFFKSGLTKIADFNKTIALFTDEYKVPVLPPEIAAILSTTAELSLPVLLVIGLFTRFAGAGLFAMTLVIELFVYPSAVTGLAENQFIMLLAFAIVAFGSGRLGVDAWLFKRAG